jgi:eukaryotic-like serine/threonine-protein kinase
MAVESVVDPMIGRVFGSYQVTGRIGAGGMATVYRAIRRGLDQERAIKILPPHLTGDRTLVERFSREARTAALLRHPNIVQIYDVASVNGLHYIAMELVAGRSLDELLRREGVLAVPRVLHSC